MPDRAASSVLSSRWSSIVWKLTVFVGVVVALNGAALIGVTYLATQLDSSGSDSSNGLRRSPLCGRSCWRHTLEKS